MFRSIFDKAIDGILIADPKTKRFVMANAAMCRFLGYKHEEILNMTVADIHPKKQLRAIMEKFNNHAEGTVGVDENIPCQRKDGSVVYADISGKTILMDGKSFTVGFFRDVTDRKRAEEESRQKEISLKEAQRVGMIGSWDWNAKTDIITWSDELYRIFGQNKKQHPPGYLEHLKLYTTESQARLDMAVKIAMNTGASYSIDLQQATADGTKRWVIARGEVMHDEKGRIIGLRGTAHDITDRKEHEEQIARLNRAFRLIANSNQILVHATDEKALLDEICKTIVVEGGYRMAWVGFAEKDARKTIRPAAQWGDERGFLKSLKFSWGGNERYFTPMGMAIQSGKPVAMQDVLTSRRSAPWFKEVKKRGYASVLALPLRTDHEVLGGLVLFSKQPHSFNHEEVRLMMEFAHDLAYGISALRLRKQLKDSEQKYRGLYDSLTDAFVRVDMAGNLIEFNQAYADMLGYSKNELRKFTFRDITPKKWHAAESKTVLEQVLRHGYSDVYEKEYVRKNGTVIPIELRTFLLRDQSGKPESMWAIVRDISERKKAGEALQKSEKRYHDIFEASKDALMLLDEKGFFDCNQATLKIFGYKTVSEFCSKHPGQVSPPAQPDGTPSVTLANQRIREAFKKGSSSFEWIHQRKNGEIFTASVMLVPFELEGQKVLQATVRDISPRKQTETALMSSEIRYRRLFEAAKDGILILDYETGKIVDVNPFLIQMLGMEKNKFTGRQLWEIGFFKDIARNKASFLELKRKKIIRYENLPLETATGRTINVEFVSNVYDVGSQKVIQCNIRDITIRRKAETDLQNSRKLMMDVLDNNSALIYIVDTEGRFLLANKKLEKLFDAAPGGMIGRTREELIPQIIADEHRKNDLRVIRTGKTITFNEKNIERDGIHFYSSVKFPLRDAQGKIYGIGGISTDITENKKLEEALYKFKLGIEKSNQVIFMTDAEGKIIYVNDSFEKTYGFTAKEALGKTPRILKSGILPALFYKNFWDALLKKEIVTGEIINKSKDGKMLTLNGSVNPILDEKGKIIGFMAIQTDVTAQKETEEDLIESETRYRTLMNSLPMCIKLFDSKGGLLTINHHGRKEHSLQGWTDVQLKQWQYLKCIIPEDRPKVKKALRDALKGKASSFVMKHTHHHARGGFCQSNLAPVIFNGNIRYVLFSSMDVTEEKKMEIQLRKSHDDLEKRVAERTEDLAYKNAVLNTELESSIDGILIISHQGKILSMNRRFGEMWRIPQSILNSENDKKMIDFVLSQLQNPGEFTSEIKRLYGHKTEKSRAAIKFTDGRVFDRYTAPLANKEGGYYGRLWTFRDISQEAAIDRAKSEFVSLASHQLRTPLTAIKWIIEAILERGGLSPWQNDYLTDALKSSDRTILLVNDLLNISRLDAGGIGFSPQRTDVVRFLEDIIKEVSVEGLVKNIKIAFRRPARQIITLLDQNLTRQMIVNLISNAIKYSPGGKTVTVSAGDSRGSLSISVRDQGIGISKADQQKLFTKYFRSQEAVNMDTKGSGLGLYTLKKILDICKGDIVCKSAVSKGTTFTITLPLRGPKKSTGGLKLLSHKII